MFLDSLLSILGSPLYIVEIHHDLQDSIIIKLCVRVKNHAPKAIPRPQRMTGKVVHKVLNRRTCLGFMGKLEAAGF